VELWDGGAYENLGLEPLYKPSDEGKRSLDNFVLVSDAGSPLSENPTWTSILRGNLAAPRLFDIAADQIRSLRSRIFIQDIKEKRVNGALLRMGNSTRQLDLSIKKKATRADYFNFLSDQDAQLASLFPTGLKRTGTDNFDLVARHGYEVADATLCGYGELLTQCVPWKDAEARGKAYQEVSAETR
jgi:NTE family protein